MSLMMSNTPRLEWARRRARARGVGREVVRHLHDARAVRQHDREVRRRVDRDHWGDAAVQQRVPHLVQDIVAGVSRRIAWFSARNASSTVVWCQHGSNKAPEEGGRRCVAGGRKRWLDGGFDAIRSPMGRHAMRRGRRGLRMPGVHLVHAAKRRQPCQAIAALHRTVSAPGRLTKGSAAACPPITSP